MYPKARNRSRGPAGTPEITENEEARATAISLYHYQVGALGPRGSDAKRESDDYHQGVGGEIGLRSLLHVGGASAPLEGIAPNVSVEIAGQAVATNGTFPRLNLSFTQDELKQFSLSPDEIQHGLSEWSKHSLLNHLSWSAPG